MIGAVAVLAAALFLATACTSQDVVSEPAPSTTSAVSPAPAARATSTMAPTTTDASPEAGPTTSVGAGQSVPDHLVVIGDSIAAQLYFALDQRSGARDGPGVTYLLTAGPRFSDQWPEPLEAAVPPRGDTAAVTSFGVWLALPPDHVADTLDDQTEAETVDEIVDFLAPIVERTSWGTQVHVLAGIDDPEADAHIQAANALIGQAADRLEVPVRSLLPGTVAGRANTVTIDGRSHPVRNGADATHFCAAAVLVMADQILDDMRVRPQPVVRSDLDELLAATATTNYFTAEGCAAGPGDTATATISTS